MAEQPQVQSTLVPWSQYMVDLYKSQKGPTALGTVNFDEIEEKAREKLKDYKGAFYYAYGSAGNWSTYKGNLRAFEKYRIVPRMLVDASTRSLEVTLFGQKLRAPILIAPIGVQGIFMEEGESAAAKAAQKLKIPFIMSTASSRSIERLAKDNGDGLRWYQLYWPLHDDVTLSILRRAKNAGFTALVVTLDTMTIGWRPHDLETAYMPFGHGVGIEVGRSDPAFMARIGRQPVADHTPTFPYDPKEKNQKYVEGDEKTREDIFIGTSWLAEANSGKFRSWDELKLIRDNWEGPLLLKGIQNIQDTLLAIEHGVNGIIVSNHGGRQVDGAIPSLYALANITKNPKVKEAQASGKLTILFDSGIRTGPDIIKALALGAQAVLLGRPWLYGGIVAGQAGIEQVINHTMGDLDTTLGLAGFRSLDEVQGKAEEILEKVDF